MASAIAIEGIEQTLRDEWKSLDENERSELMGRVTGVVLFEVVTLGTANAAKAGKFGKLDGLLDGLPLSPAARDRITGYVRDAVARFKGERLVNNALPVLNKTCFVADTPILTPDGSKPIQQFKPGDIILSRPEDEPQTAVRPSVVEELFELSAPILELRLGGQTIETTAEHPFYVSGKGWVRAEQLEVDDLLVGHDDQLTAVESVSKTDRHEIVYNVRVANDHTYFVGDEDWGFSVWVHNAYSIKKAADGTYEVVDDVGRVVINGIGDQAAAKRLSKVFNNFSINFTDDFYRKIHSSKHVSRLAGGDKLTKIQALKRQYPDLADIPNQIGKKTSKVILDRIEQKGVLAYANRGFDVIPDRRFGHLVRVQDGWVTWFFDLSGNFRSIVVN